MFLLDALHEDFNRIIKKPYIEDIEYDGTHVLKSSAADSNISTSSSKNSANSRNTSKKSCIPEEEPVVTKRLMSEKKVAKLAWIAHLKRNQSVIVDLTQGQLRNVLQCATCNFKSVKFVPFMYLFLPLVKSGTHSTYVNTDIQACLREWKKIEKLDGDCQWNCPQCKKPRDATKQLTIWCLPNVLIVQLKRFHMQDQRRIKVDTMVDIPLQGLDVSEAMCTYNDRRELNNCNNKYNNGNVGSPSRSLATLSADSADSPLSTTFGGSNNVTSGKRADKGIDGPVIKGEREDEDEEGQDEEALQKEKDNADPMYDLYGVSNHHGSGHGSGHYTSYCKNPQDQNWYVRS